MRPLRLYRERDSWVLGQCENCGNLNYVEPHGTTAACSCSERWVEHRNIPSEFCDANRIYCIQRPPFARRAEGKSLFED